MMAKDNRCVHDDDIQQTYSGFTDADVAICAIPIYWGRYLGNRGELGPFPCISGSLKSFSFFAASNFSGTS